MKTIFIIKTKKIMKIKKAVFPWTWGKKIFIYTPKFMKVLTKTIIMKTKKIIKVDKHENKLNENEERQ